MTKMCTENLGEKNEIHVSTVRFELEYVVCNLALALHCCLLMFCLQIHIIIDVMEYINIQLLKYQHI